MLVRGKLFEHKENTAISAIVVQFVISGFAKFSTGRIHRRYIYIYYVLYSNIRVLEFSVTKGLRSLQRRSIQSSIMNCVNFLRCSLMHEIYFISTYQEVPSVDQGAAPVTSMS